MRRNRIQPPSNLLIWLRKTLAIVANATHFFRHDRERAGDANHNSRAQGSSRSFAASGAGAARCVGCENRSAEGRQKDRISGTNDGGIEAGERGGREPPRRLSGRSEEQCGEVCTGSVQGADAIAGSCVAVSVRDQRVRRPRAVQVARGGQREKQTSRAAGVATRPVRMFASSRNALDGDAEAVGPCRRGCR